MNTEARIFCGMTASAGSTAICQFVMGRSDVPGTIKSLNSWLMDQMRDHKPIELIEPVLIHRVFTMEDLGGGRQKLAVTHQIIEDPYWPCYRDAKVPFNPGHFLMARFLDDSVPSQQEEITRYANSLTQRFAAKSGIHLPK